MSRPVWIVACALLAAGCRGGAAGTATRPIESVLLVTIDTLRADRLGCYGDALARTPSADALARAGTLFEAAFTPAPLTLPAHATLLTGLVPPDHGVRANGSYALGSQVPTLAEAMHARGRQTAAFIGGFPLVRRFGLARGFDHYDDAVEKAPGLHFEFAERRGDMVAAAAVDWLGRHPGAVFVWAHFFDPHAPYHAPEEVSGEDPYRAEIAWTDLALGRLLTAWDRRPQGSLVVLAADHGEAFGEHGEWSHGLFVYDTTLRVPLLVRGGSFAAGRRIATAVGLEDVAATILEAVGGAGPALPGLSLARALEAGASDRPLYSETLAPRLDFGWSELRAWREGRLKRIRAPRGELYDWRADPGESRDLGASRPADAARLDVRLDAEMGAAGEREARRPPDADASARLRALGYVEGPGGRGSGADPKDHVDLARRIAQATGPFEGPEAAARLYRELRDLDPENPLLNLRLADALLRAGRPAEAVPAFHRVAEGGPRTADAHLGLATSLAALGRFEDARRALEGGLSIDPGNGQLHYNLGELARARGDTSQAQRHYQDALADPVTSERAQARLKELP